MARNYDVVFVGGAIMAAATAYNLLEKDPGLKIAIVEKDPTYQFAATPLALGGVRQQFSTRVNIRMARQSIDIFENFGEIFETKLGKPQIDFRQGGYLFLVGEEKWPTAMENAAIQKEEGVELEILTPEEITDRLPGMHLDDVVGGTVCPREGILDPQQLLQGYIKKVKEMGAEFIYDEVVGIEVAGGQAKGVSLKSGDKISAGAVVNAAGPWAGEVAKMAGVEIPVKPLAHDLYVCKISPDLKLGRAYTTFPSTTWYFQEHEGGDTMLTGKTKLDFKLEFSFTPDRDFFYDEVWPDLAERNDGFDAIKLLNVWRGCYEYNDKDFNAIIGEHPELKKFYLINGFSGHGLMQAPAAGRGLAEKILYGEYKTLDLTEVGFERFAENKLIVEKAII